MNESIQNTPYSSLSAEHKESLARLEWDKITHYLSQFATLNHTKEILKAISPWSLKYSAEYYSKITEEVFLLFEKGLNLPIGNFSKESFEKPLKMGALLSGTALYQIYCAWQSAYLLASFFKENRLFSNQLPLLQQQGQALKPNSPLAQKLAKSITPEGEVDPNATPELAAAHRQLTQAKRRISESCERLLKTSSIQNALQDSTWMFRDGRFVLPVRMDRKNEVDGIARGVSSSGSTIFIEPRVLSQDQAALEKAQMEIEIEEHKVLKNLSEECSLNKDMLFENIHTLIHLDEVHARAQFCNALQASPCEMDSRDGEKFFFQNARHPLFVLEKKACIPNNIELNQSQIMVLSGPNAGGKTVVLKTIGVFALMAQCGLFVPADKARCLDYKNIFVLLGDSQNRQEDLSTFSGHLNHIKHIMSQSNKDTLVLLDEGFVGTDPAVGVALARSVLEYFAKKGATVIITTHFSALKNCASQDSRFANASMEFEARNLRPTYKLLNGIPGQSYALELCQRMGIDMEVIDQARVYVGEEAQRVEKLLQELQGQKVQVEEELSLQKSLSAQVQAALTKIQSEQKSLVELKESLVEGYRTKLTKRLNAFANRLEIRERQFERAQKEKLAEIAKTESLSHEELRVSSNIETNVQEEKFVKETLKKQDKQEKKTLTSFEALSQLQIKSFPKAPEKPILEPEHFRAPKKMTSRSLLDEANESLSILEKSFHKMEENLEQDVNEVVKINKDVKEKAQHVQTTIHQQTQKNSLKKEDWKPGMRVKTERFRDVGQVLKPADNKGLVECQFGLIKVKIPFGELMTVEQAAQKKPTYANLPVRNHRHSTEKNTLQNRLDLDLPPALPHKGNTIDLRGMIVDEALENLERGLDKMSLSGVETVIVVHGHGQGKVKDAVRKHLEVCSYELSFRPGRSGEGGDGVTVVHLIG